MCWYVSPLILLFLIFRSYDGNNDFLKTQMSGFAQGTTWHITYYAKDSIVRKAQIDSILTRIDSSLSIYKPFSLVSRFNASKNGIVIDDHFATVVAHSIAAWQQS
ncbi:MAG TPA: FAD:protein FMN transferase, partial [Agriterribacter sp.]|nr:FAD:protein FMN transferase [Agriterribacter sp.]